MICTGPSVPENISVSETWSDEGYRYSPSSSPPPPLAKWITCPSQFISSVVCKHSLRVWYPFILQGGEGYCNFRVMPRNTTQWPVRSRTSQGKRVFQANRLIETRRKSSPPPLPKGEQLSKPAGIKRADFWTTNQTTFQKRCLLSYSVLTLKMSTSSAVLPLNLRACHRRKHYLFTACLL